MAPLSYLIVGSGHRAEFYARVACTYPALFRAQFLCRSAEKAALIQARTGVPATDSLQTCARFGPDCIVVAVSKGSIASVCAEWLERGYPVVSETPAGACLEQLHRLWALAQRPGARLTVCEQYHRYPLLAAGLDAVAHGRIGTPRSAYLSLAHDYHAASLLRRMLLTQGERYVLRAQRTQSPLVETDSRQGAVTDGRLVTETRDVAAITFASGKTAVYDFADVQYRTFLRARHLTVRGERGEWNDTLLYSLDAQGRPRRDCLLPTLPDRYAALDTQALRDARKTWQPELFLDTRQDEYAIATVLYDLPAYLAGGPSPYPLREALDDAYFWLLLQRAVADPQAEVASQPMPWNDGV